MGMAMFNAWSKENKVPTFGYDANADAVAAIADGEALPSALMPTASLLMVPFSSTPVPRAARTPRVRTGIGTADDAGNVLSDDVFKYVESERSYYMVSMLAVM